MHSWHEREVPQTEHEARQEPVTRALVPPAAADRRSGRDGSVFDGLDILEILDTVVRLKPDLDGGLAGHCPDVVWLAVKTAERLGFDPAGVAYVALSSYLHDAGKRAPHLTLLSILNRSDEAGRACTACAIPSRIFTGAHLPGPVSHALDHLYETFNGSGVPDGLRGDAIPIISRIIAVADSFVDLTVNEGNFLGATLSPAEAVAVIKMHGGMLFDPAVVEALAAVVVAAQAPVDGTERAGGANAALAGGLGEIPLPDIVQLLAQGRRSGRLLVSRNSHRGEIRIEEGRVVDAVTGDVRGEDAFHEIICWEQGAFSFEPGAVAGGGTITRGTVELILEALRRLDESRR
jgi:hypothetical protein